MVCGTDSGIEAVVHAVCVDLLKGVNLKQFCWSMLASVMLSTAYTGKLLCTISGESAQGLVVSQTDGLFLRPQTSAWETTLPMPRGCSLSIFTDSTVACSTVASSLAQSVVPNNISCVIVRYLQR